MDEWKPASRWRVISPEGTMYETSDEDELRRWLRVGDKLEKLWQRTEDEWRPV